MKQTAKMEDIAQITGLNISTVSRALKNKPDISLATRKKVKSVANEIGYKTHYKRNNIIGILLPEVTSRYYSELAHALEEKLKNNGFEAIFMLTKFSNNGIKSAFKLLLKQGVAGILINKTGDAINYDFIVKAGIPAVLLSEGDMEAHVPIDSIRISTDSEMRLALNHLIDLGHSSIGYIGEYLSDIRFNTLLRLMKENSIKIHQEFFKRGKERFEEGGYLRAKELLGERVLPTAIIASYDQIAIGAMSAFNEAGINIPKDLSIIGIDNIVINDYLSTKLTSITNPTSQMGAVAVKLLMDNIKDPEEHIVQTVALQSKLVERGSTSNPLK